MSDHNTPAWYNYLKEKYPEFIKSVEKMGKTARQEGPLKEKFLQLIQLGGAAAIRSEGSVHSHVRRALEAGASKDEVFHALIALTSTIGFPNVAAALNWAEEEINKQS